MGIEGTENRNKLFLAWNILSAPGVVSITLDHKKDIMVLTIYFKVVQTKGGSKRSSKAAGEDLEMTSTVS